MKMKRLIKASMLLMVAILFAACANEDIAQDKKKENGTEAPKGGVVFATNDTKISAKHRFIDEDEFARAKTRTNIKHTPGNGADAYWTSDDFIWVKDKNGNWQQSTAITLNDGGASAEFTLPGSMSDYADGCEVRYTGPNSYVGPSAEYVTISNTATCTTPNDFSKAGDWGDCGSGTARNTGNPNKFNFTLAHKSSYLCFLPRCENAALAPNVRLKSITITATKCYSPGLSGYIADCYDFDGENLSGSPYMLGTKSIVANISDFPLYTTANQTANATYMVVLPGTYDFKIVYTIKDPTTNVEMAFSQMLTNVTLNKGEINDITANLVPPTGPIYPRYYMWDAVNYYWFGFENDDPTVSSVNPGRHYPDKDNHPLELNNRWYHEGTGAIAASQSCAICPNVNELFWYVNLGDPHWQPNNSYIITNDGHLISIGGLWLKKKAAIIRDNSQIFSAANGGAARFSSGFPIDKNPLSSATIDRDWRTETTAAFGYSQMSNPPIIYSPSGLPNPSDYFFLLAAGYYYRGELIKVGSEGNYWSSSADPKPSGSGLVYTLAFTNGHVVLHTFNRLYGYPAQAFE